MVKNTKDLGKRWRPADGGEVLPKEMAFDLGSEIPRADRAKPECERAKCVGYGRIGGHYWVRRQGRWSPCQEQK